ncbi:MAG: hypothetical protein KDK24_20590 [Pseudooceanicola sp.]|nr:hypothetical protein [Pseudooceanicola sp.]
MKQAAQDGARNLLGNCAGMTPGQTLLLIAEDPAHGYYEAATASAVIEAALSLGLRPVVRELPFQPDPHPLAPQLLDEMRAADQVLFLARTGDQMRFDPAMAGIRPVVSYALNAAALASDFGRAHHHAFVALKRRIDAAMAAAGTIRVTCALGTDLAGPGRAAECDTSILRFPMTVFAPLAMAGYSGRIAQAGFLTGTGSRYYAPYTVPLDDVLFVHIDGHRIVGFAGTPSDMDRAARHYRDIGDRFGIPWDHVHSWHAGIHPGCRFDGLAGDAPERWSGSAFGSPRVMHLHTCGDYAPGEISLNVTDPTIALDGVEVWKQGRLYPALIPGGADILARYDCAAKAFALPPRPIGLGPGNRLSQLQSR